MKIALGCDHRGAEAVTALSEHLQASGHEPALLGQNEAGPCDYPDSAYLVATAVRTGQADCGILVCGSGVGMSMSANKVPGIRAALAYDEFVAEISRRHNDANVLCMSGDLCTVDQICAITDAFLSGAFEGGRHERRVKKMSAIERGEDPSSVNIETAPA